MNSTLAIPTRRAMTRIFSTEQFVPSSSRDLHTQAAGWCAHFFPLGVLMLFVFCLR